MKFAYYNEFDPYAAQWLRNLIKEGYLPDGEVDERSIRDVDGKDLAGFRQCHFFAGIGGWPLAIRLSGWPEEEEVWTGSCPCQPFSAAGSLRGVGDERHLWPAFRDLIAERRPPTCFGEQVAGGDGLLWLSGVRADLEAIGYAVGATDLPAACVGAPHIRQRLFWVANAISKRRSSAESITRTPQLLHGSTVAKNGYAVERLGDTIGSRLEERSSERRDDEPQCAPAERAGSNAGGVADADGWITSHRELQRSRKYGQQSADSRINTIWLPCLDGKARRTQPSIQPLVDGLPAAMDGLGPVSRVGSLKGAGNAIVPQVAALFIDSYLKARP